MRNVGAVVLAAGGSTRLGEPKQFLQWEGESLIRRAVRAAAEGECVPVVVVVGRESEFIATELRETRAQLVRNPVWERGLGSSIRSGVQALIDSSLQPDAVVLLACDQPFVDAKLISTLIAQWQSSGKGIVASRYADTHGVPALFDRSCFAALVALPDDSGAKALIQARPSDVAEVEFEAGAFDVDTAADYARAQARLSSEQQSPSP